MIFLDDIVRRSYLAGFGIGLDWIVGVMWRDDEIRLSLIARADRIQIAIIIRIYIFWKGNSSLFHEILKFGLE